MLDKKVVNAEELRKVVYDNKLTDEAKILIIAARLAGGSLPRIQAPKSRGSGSYDVGRSLLRQQRKANAPFNQPNVLVLNDDVFPRLAPNDQTRKPSAPKSETPPRTQSKGG